MTDQNPEVRPGRSSGDRRGQDRRSSDRRAPPPPWRRPSAFVAYGVVVTLILVALLGGEEEPVAEFPDAAENVLAATKEPAALAPPGTPSRQAFSVAELERLVAEGETAVGEVVQAELYCGSISSIALRQVDDIDPRLAGLADADRRVPAAECLWSRDSRSADFLLVVPAELAVSFASGAEVELNFIRRRRVAADVLWLGRSEGLALRTAGILMEVRGAAR